MALNIEFPAMENRGLVQKNKMNVESALWITIKVLGMIFKKNVVMYILSQLKKWQSDI